MKDSPKSPIPSDVYPASRKGMRNAIEHCSRTWRMAQSSRRAGKSSGDAATAGTFMRALEAPEECPACQHPRAYYELLGENY